MTTYSLKVTRAEREGMKIINPTRQTYINVTDSTACVPYIVTQCREDFDDDCLELVTANGLAIEDSESTRGNSSFSVPVSLITDNQGMAFYDLTLWKTKVSNLHLSILLLVGLPFWKANSRKLFAVSTICKKERKRKKTAADEEIVSVDDDSDGVSTKSSNLSLTLQSGIHIKVKGIFAKHVLITSLSSM